MRVYVDFRFVDVDVAFRPSIDVAIEPGLWQVEQDQGGVYSVTSLNGTVTADGELSFRTPKGVPRRPSGAWGARERLLADPCPVRHWGLVPAEVREAINDAYLLQHAALPDSLGDAL